MIARSTLCRAGALGWMAIIVWLSSLSDLPIPDRITLQDKFAHFAAYAVLAAMYVGAFPALALRSRWLLMLAATVAAALFGASDEWHQSFVPGREASALDWLADLAGGLAGAMTATHLDRAPVPNEGRC